MRGCLAENFAHSLIDKCKTGRLARSSAPNAIHYSLNKRHINDNCRGRRFKAYNILTPTPVDTSIFCECSSRHCRRRCRHAHYLKSAKLRRGPTSKIEKDAAAKRKNAVVCANAPLHCRVKYRHSRRHAIVLYLLAAGNYDCLTSKREAMIVHVATNLRAKPFCMRDDIGIGHKKNSSSVSKTLSKNLGQNLRFSKRILYYLNAIAQQVLAHVF